MTQTERGECATRSTETAGEHLQRPNEDAGRTRLWQSMGQAVVVRAVILVASLFFFDVGTAEGDPRQVDISVAGIFLWDPDSVRRVLGSPPRPLEKPGEDDAPVLEVCNARGREVLTLVHHCGTTADYYSAFRVRRTQRPPARCLTAPEDTGQFVTGRGVRLGMSKKRLVALFGQRFSEERNGPETVIRYDLTDPEKTLFLKRYNQVAYFGIYRFQDAKLVSFEFGFVYP